MDNIPHIDDPKLRFMDWEDRPMAILNFSVFHVSSKGDLTPAHPDLTVTHLMHNASPISRQEALLLANR